MLGLGFRIGTVASVLAHLPALTLPALKPFAFVNINPDYLQFTEGSLGQPVYNHARLSQGWTPGDNVQPDSGFLNARGYPTHIPSGTSYVQNLFNVKGAFGTSDDARMVLESSQLTAQLQPLNQTVTSDAVVNGVRRIEFTVNNPQPYNSVSNVVELIMRNFHAFVPDVDYIDIFQANQETAFKAGDIFEPQAISRVTPFSALRYMDWNGANDLTSWEQLPAFTSSKWWGPGVPMEVQVAYANATGCNFRLNIPHGTPDAEIVRRLQYVQAHKSPNLRCELEYSNEIWNYKFQQFGYVSGLPIPEIPGEYPTWTKAGYQSAHVMAVAMRAVNYDPSFTAVLCSQAGNAAVLSAGLAGVKQWIAAVSDSANPARDTGFAAKYTRPADMYASMGPAAYCNGNVGNSTPSDADRAMLERMAATTDDSGVLCVARQIIHGDLIDPGISFLDRFSSLYQYERQYSAEEGIPLSFYEMSQDAQGFCSDAVHQLYNRYLDHPVCRQVTAMQFNAARAAGFTYGYWLSDIGEQHSTYGLLDSPDPTKRTTQRWLGTIDAIAGVVTAVPQNLATIMPTSSAMFTRTVFFSTPFFGA